MQPSAKNGHVVTISDDELGLLKGRTYERLLGCPRYVAQGKARQRAELPPSTNPLKLPKRPMPSFQATTSSFSMVSWIKVG